MSSLILVRHGETDWNAERRYQGHSNLPLNETGRAQATAAADVLHGETFDAAYTSDLVRTTQTARIILERHPAPPLQLAPNLREMHFGLWEGLTHHEIAAQYPDQLAAWYAGAEPPEGESLPAVAARVAAFLADLRGLYTESARILVVGHGGSLRILLCLALGLPAEKHWQFKIEAASITRLDVYENGAILARLNDTAHLRT